MAHRAISSGKDTAILETALGSYLEFEHRHDEAIRAYRRAVALDPGDVVAQNNLALILAYRGEVKEAEKLIDHVIDRRGPAPAFLDSRGCVRLAAGRVDDAIRDFDAAIKDQPTSIRLFHLAMAQHRAKHLAEAKETFRRAVEAGLQPEQLNPAEKSDFFRMSKQFSS
jgi:tetratricopeptide (TPR) repeat protein